ncbi:MAG: MlaD family protein [Muribaculum sp.]|nr:MlaD family protein [Muribaculaceae bacterium]MCM1081806.1 MlaD family protein [Muribaculum sp.]
MKRFSKEFKIGISIIVAAVVLFSGINYLKGVNVFKAANYYYVSYENVNGLTISSPVTLNGYKVGQVRDIAYEYDNPGHVLVELSLDKKLKIPAGTKAVINLDILGTASVVLEFSDNTENHVIGDRLIGETAPSLMTDLSDNMLPTISSVIAKVDTLLTGVNSLLSDSAILNSVRRLDKITSNLELVTAQLNRSLATLPSTMDGMNSTVHNLDTITADLTVLTSQFKQINIATTMLRVDSIASNLNWATGQLTTPNNSVGLLLNDRKIYDNLDNATTTIDSILIDVKKNPRRYIPPIKIF